MFACSGKPAIAAPCESWASLSLPHVKITLAESVAPVGIDAANFACHVQ